jgi:HAMP domain-containing protein
VIGTFLRFMLLRVIGARGAVILGAIAFILGRRRQRDLPRRGETDRTA